MDEIGEGSSRCQLQSLKKLSRRFQPQSRQRDTAPRAVELLATAGIPTEAGAPLLEPLIPPVTTFQTWQEWRNTCAVMKCGEPSQTQLLKFCERLLTMQRGQVERAVMQNYTPQPHPEQMPGQSDDDYQRERADRRNNQMAQVLDGNLWAYFACEAKKPKVSLPAYKAALLELTDPGEIEYKVKDVVVGAIRREGKHTLNRKYVKTVSATGGVAKFYVIQPMQSTHESVDRDGNLREPNIPDESLPKAYEFELAEPPSASDGRWQTFLTAWELLDIRMRVGVFLRIQDFRGIKVSWDVDPVRAMLAELVGKPKLSTYAIYALRDEAKQWLELQATGIPFDQRRSHGLWMVRQIEGWAESEKTCASLHNLPMKKTAS